MLLSQRWTTQSALGYVVSEMPALGFLAGVGLLGRATLSGYLVSAGLLSPLCAILSALGHSLGAGICSQHRAGVGLFCRRWSA